MTNAIAPQTPLAKLRCVESVREQGQTRTEADSADLKALPAGSVGLNSACVWYRRAGFPSFRNADGRGEHLENVQHPTIKRVAFIGRCTLARRFSWPPFDQPIVGPSMIIVYDSGVTTTIRKTRKTAPLSLFALCHM